MHGNACVDSYHWRELKPVLTSRTSRDFSTFVIGELLDLGFEGVTCKNFYSLCQSPSVLLKVESSKF